MCPSRFPSTLVLGHPRGSRGALEQRHDARGLRAGDELARRPAVHGGRGDERRALHGLDRVLVALDLRGGGGAFGSDGRGRTFG